MCILHIWQVSKEGTRGSQILCNWNCRQLWTAMQMLVIEPRSSGRIVVLFHWLISLAPYLYSQTHSLPFSSLLRVQSQWETQHYILLLINSKHLFNHLCYTSSDSHKHQVCFYLHHILMVFMVRSFVAIATVSFCLLNTLDIFYC